MRRDYERPVARVFLDIMTLLMILMVAVIALMAWDISAKKKDDVNPGNLIVELVWESFRNVDLDLWVRDPAGTPVGFSNMASPWCNLERDDLGQVAADDRFGENFERATCRGPKPGDVYVVTVFVYSDKERTGFPLGRGPMARPVEAKITIKFSARFDERKTTVLTRVFTCSVVGQEYAVAEIEIGAGKDGLPEVRDVRMVQGPGNVREDPVPAFTLE